jgi:hypothetical protein
LEVEVHGGLWGWWGWGSSVRHPVTVGNNVCRFAIREVHS